VAVDAARRGEPSSNLPAPVSSFIGRQADMAEVRRSLASSRLVTLTGPGGSGKTRLALELASMLLAGSSEVQPEAFEDGAWFVELAALDDGKLIAQAVAAALGVREMPGTSIDRELTLKLQNRKLLLVLDNCEHIRAASAALVGRLLAACPSLHVLATSRQPLGLAGEVVRTVQPLPTPPENTPPEVLTWYAAARLFLDRAAAVAPSIDLTEQTAAAIARICRQLDGLPLALELAATRVRGLGIQELADRLDRRFVLLTGGNPAGAPRHQTLRATIAWSHDALEPAEARLFRRLAVFARGWSLEAAETVCGDADASDVLPVLLELVDRSLVVIEQRPDGSVRYRMLESIREFALEQIAASGEYDVLRQRHADLFHRLAQVPDGTLDSGPRQIAWLDRLELEHDNLVAVLRWSVDAGDVERAWHIGAAVATLSIWRGQASAAHVHLAQLLSASRAGCSVDTQLRALECEAELAFPKADYALAAARHEEQRDLAQRIGDQRGARAALIDQAHALRELSEYAGARRHLDESLALAISAGDRHLIGVSLDLLGTVAHATGDYATAHTRYAEALAIAREVNDHLLLAWTPFNLGLLALDAGRFDEARQLLTDSGAIWRKRRATDGVVHALAALTSLAAAEGAPEKALRLAGATTALSEASGCPVAPYYRRRFERSVSTCRGALPVDLADEAWAEGRGMTQAQAIADGIAPTRPLSNEQLVESDGVSRREVESDGLSRRELEVLRLLASGMTNREIASELVLSVKTVMHHSVSIYRKLGVRGRGQATAYAVKRQLFTDN
jgi:predicted ATPase/DNA-binding CsgD family transcriptional regulator